MTAQIRAVAVKVINVLRFDPEPGHQLGSWKRSAVGEFELSLRTGVFMSLLVRSLADPPEWVNALAWASVSE